MHCLGPGSFGVTGSRDQRFWSAVGHSTWANKNRKDQNHPHKRLNETEETGQQKESRKARKSQKSRSPHGIQVRHTAPIPYFPASPQFLFCFLAFSIFAPFSHRVFNEIISPAKPSYCESNITWGKPYTHIVLRIWKRDIQHTV